METWYLLVELKGISHTFFLLALYSAIFPSESSTHFRSAASLASPLTSLLRMGTLS